MAPENNVTYREMTESQNTVKKEIMGHVSKLDVKLGLVENEVRYVKELVLPLTVAMNQTAENTKDMANSLKEFTRAQTDTNTGFKDKMHSHDLALEGIRSITNGITERKKYNVGVTVAIISLIATFIAGLFQLAPIIFN